MNPAKVLASAIAVGIGSLGWFIPRNRRRRALSQLPMMSDAQFAQEIGATISISPEAINRVRQDIGLRLRLPAEYVTPSLSLSELRRFGVGWYDYVFPVEEAIEELCRELGFASPGELPDRVGEIVVALLRHRGDVR
jgi:hypothetical protein